VRNIRNNGKEGGQTNESLNTSAAHAADAARDVVAADWKEARRPPGRGGQRKGPGEGRRRLALCGPGAARPLSLPSRSGRLGSFGPGRFTLPVARNNRSKLRLGERGVLGEAGGSRSPDLRPAPRRRTCDRCEAPHSRPPLSPSEAAGPRLAAPGLSQRPHLRGRGTAPGRPPAGPRPLARSPHSHSASTSSREAISSASRYTPRRRRRRRSCRRLNWSPPPARADKGAGAGCWVSRLPVRGSRGRGGARQPRGEDEAVRRAGPAACARSSSTPPRPPAARARAHTHTHSPTRAPQQAGARHAHSPARSPRAAGAEAS
jgi:hypothetical protein